MLSTWNCIWWFLVSVQCESKNPPEVLWQFFQNGWEFFWPNFMCLLRVPIYASNSYFQQWRSYVILSATTKRAFRSMVDILSTLWWSILIWHNFVIVAVNWIKICSPTLIGTYNRCVKFGVKIPIRVEKNVKKSGGGGFFDSLYIVRMWWLVIWWTELAGGWNWVSDRRRVIEERRMHAIYTLLSIISRPRIQHGSIELSLPSC